MLPSKLLTILATLALVLAFNAVAQSNPGAASGLDAGEFTIFLEHTPTQIRPNAKARFELRFVNNDSGLPQINQAVSLALTLNTDPIYELEKITTNEAGKINFSAKFPKVGRYLIMISPDPNNDRRLALPFNVGSPDRIFRPWEQPGSLAALMAGFGGFLLGLLVAHETTRPKDPK